ncbi:MAG: carbon-nitrogen hydrolase [Chloroflexi bacterium]|nr:carbon-nitrogen hydrolase [Chloroflexota bacterium]
MLPERTNTPLQSFRIGLAQMNPHLGDVTRNIQKHLDVVAEAEAQAVDVLLFPELSLHGYFLEDLVTETACRLDDPLLAPLIAASDRMSILFGMVEESADQRFYNSGVYLEAGRVRHLHRKVYLATYGMFDEGRYLAAGEHLRAFDTRFGRLGALICEDFWHPSAVSIVHADGADLILGISSGPGRGVSGESQDLRSAQTWHNLNNLYARMFTSYVVYCNRVGYEDGVNFWGGSEVVGPDGTVLVRAPYFEEAFVTAEVSAEAMRRQRSLLPLLRDERLDLTYRELRRIYRERYA